MTNLTPREIVEELNRFVIGQDDAKRAVATALRNRWRRKKVEGEIKDEIVPHNILLIGPTGVGKTEIARRLAKITQSPFIKIEATKFTEIGYVGREVDSIIRDLVEIAINQVREIRRKEVAIMAKTMTENRLLDAIVGDGASAETREKFRHKLTSGQLDENEVEIEVSDNTGNNPFQTFDIPGAQLGVLNVGEMLGKALGGKKTKRVKLKVNVAYHTLLQEESDKLVNDEIIAKQAINNVEEDGIVFLDEIDKIATRAGVSAGGRGEVSREGVQRDLLPLLEGTVINTKYGPVKTNHILFIASGAFHIAKPSDLLPELQGRLPIRVELQSLTESHMLQILKDPAHNLPKQYQALLAVENVEIVFDDGGLVQIAHIATLMNDRVENIGARRLHTIMEKLLENIGFTASDTPGAKFIIDKEYVNTHLAKFIQIDSDISKFIL